MAGAVEALTRGMLELYVLSDLHLEFGDFEVPTVAPDVVVVAGDLHVGVRGLVWAAERLPDVPILYVLGNHEYYRETMPRFADEMRNAAAGIDDRIKVLHRNRFELDGVVFLGATLWTDFALGGDREKGMAQAWGAWTDFWVTQVDPGNRPLEPRDLLAIHEQERSWLEESFGALGGKRMVVVTHHPPSASSVPEFALADPWSSAYASALDPLVESSGAALWIHGHIHTPADYIIGTTRVLSNPRGYVNRGRGPHENFRPDLVVEV